jgi:hypothetical protein
LERTHGSTFVSRVALLVSSVQGIPVTNYGHSSMLLVTYSDEGNPLLADPLSLGLALAAMFNITSAIIEISTFWPEIYHHHQQYIVAE